MSDLKLELVCSLCSTFPFSTIVNSIQDRSEFEKISELLSNLDEGQPVPWEWLDFFDGSSARAFSSIPEAVLGTLPQLNEAEQLLLDRWLLERMIRDFGRKGHKKGKASALDLVEMLLHRLMGKMSRGQILSLLEGLLPLAGDHTLGSDLYHWLFSHSFLEDPNKLEPLVYAGRGLERAKLSGNRERIAWSYYNLAHYHSHLDGEEAEALLDEAIDFLRDERYFDILGTIAMKYLETGREERAIVYLESVSLFLQRQYEQGEWPALDTMIFNLVYYSLSLALALYHRSNYKKALGLLDFLLNLLEESQVELINLGLESPFPDMDWKFQYFSFRTEAFLWAYACLLQLGNYDEGEDLLSDFRNFIAHCPYPMDAVMERFSKATQIHFPL